MMERFQEVERSDWTAMQSPNGLAHIGSSRCLHFQMYYGGMLLTPLMFLGFITSARKFWVAAFSTVAVLSVGMATSWFHPHYAAPIVPCLALFLAAGIRKAICLEWGSRHPGRVYVAATVFFYAALLVVSYISTVPKGPFQLQRTKVIRDLEAKSGEHLVLVAYASNHNPNNEWVYNAADIDASRIVWARDVEEQRLRELLAYYPDRTVWRVNADAKKPEPVKLRDSLVAQTE